MFSKKFYATLAVTALVAACASKPVNMPSIAGSTNAANEIENTQRMLNEARQQQIDVLSPKNFAASEKALEKAKKMKDKNKDNADILEELAYSQGFLQDAKSKAEISSLTMKSITTARADAMKAEANSLLPKEWADAEKDLEKITTGIEKGNITKADRQGDEVTSMYKDLEIKAVQKANLGIAYENITIAKKADAAKFAPKTYSMATMKYDNAYKLIIADPKNTEAIRRASADATRESVHLAQVLDKVGAGNSEDLVLMAERQQRTITGLRKEATTTEKELTAAERQKQALEGKTARLEKTQEAVNTAEALRKQFKPSEAEVFVDNDKVRVRLKALQFPTNQAVLGPKNQAFLKKVDAALQDVQVSSLTVEGHTDSTGDAQKNTALSEKRAQSVEKYLSSNGSIKSNQIQAVGLGSENPVSDNSTARGRAENRRIDLVIETQ